MNTLFHVAMHRSTTALLIAGRILGMAVLPASAADQAAADAELQAAAPMIEQMQRHLNTAAKAVQAGDAKAAREAFAKADRVFALTRDFLRATESEPDEALAPNRLPAMPPAPRRAPGRQRFWPDTFGDEDGFADRLFGGRDPFAMLRDMQERMGHLLDQSDWLLSTVPDDSGRMRSPRMDMTESKEAYIVRLDMPGLEKTDIQVKVEGVLLTITGRSESEAETRADDDKPLRRERRSGMFKRVVTLPGPVQADKVDARYENGVLTITVPKAPELPVDPRSIPIH